MIRLLTIAPLCLLNSGRLGLHRGSIRYPAMLFEQSMDEDGLTDSFWISKRAVVKPRSPALSSKIIGSKDSAHSALKLCQSQTSKSPDFVSFFENIFCDMATKTPWPLCASNATSNSSGATNSSSTIQSNSSSLIDNCYHWDTHTLFSNGIKNPMNYTDVHNWE